MHELKDLEKSMRISPKCKKNRYVGLKVCAKKGYPSTTHYAKSLIVVQKVDLTKPTLNY